MIRIYMRIIAWLTAGSASRYAWTALEVQIVEQRLHGCLVREPVEEPKSTYPGLNPVGDSIPGGTGVVIQALFNEMLSTGLLARRHCLPMASFSRSSGVIRWSWLSSPMSS